MTPEMPPVSPDPWKDLLQRARDMRNRAAAQVPGSSEQALVALMFILDDIDAARAADALRHQQEIAEAKQRTIAQAQTIHANRAILAAQDETIQRLRAKFSTAEATIQRQAEEIEELKAERDAAELRYRVTYKDLCDQTAQAVTLRAECTRLRDALTAEQLAGMEQAAIVATLQRGAQP